MVAATAFVLGFIALGLLVVFTAFGGGPRGVRSSMHRQSRSSGKLTAVAGILVLAVFGLGIPALVLASNAHNDSHHAVGGVKLTKAQEHGRQLFATNCATCHTLAAANAVGKVGPNLDELRPNTALILNAIAVGRAQGNGQMPQNLLQGQDAKDVAAFVANAAGH